MKTKVLKFMIPALTVMMSVGLAFGTSIESIPTNAYIEGPTGEPIPVTVSCNDTSQDVCIYMGSPVFKNVELTDPLHRTQ